MKIILNKPPTTNHIYAIRSFGGHAIMYITKEGKDWFASAASDLKKQWRKKTPIEAPVEVWIDIFLSRDRDIDGSVKPLLDLLQKNGVLKNDSQVYKIDVEKHKCEKDKDHVEIEIMGY